MSSEPDRIGRRWTRIPIWGVYGSLIWAATPKSPTLLPNHIVNLTPELGVRLVAYVVAGFLAGAVAGFAVTLFRTADPLGPRYLTPAHDKVARVTCVTMALGLAASKFLETITMGKAIYQIEELVAVEIILWFVLSAVSGWAVKIRHLIFGYAVICAAFLQVMGFPMGSYWYGCVALFFFDLALRKPPPPPIANEAVVNVPGLKPTRNNNPVPFQHTEGTVVDATTDSTATKYAMLMKYSDKAREAASAIEALPADLQERFKAEATAAPARVGEIAAAILRHHDQQQRPFGKHQLDTLYQKLGAVGADAQQEFRRVIEYLGDDVEPEKVAHQAVLDSAAFARELAGASRLVRAGIVQYCWGLDRFDEEKDLHQAIVLHLINQHREGTSGFIQPHLPQKTITTGYCLGCGKPRDLAVTTCVYCRDIRPASTHGLPREWPPQSPEALKP